MDERRASVDEPLLPTERDPRPPTRLERLRALPRRLRTSTVRLSFVGALLVAALYLVVLRDSPAARPPAVARPSQGFAGATPTPAQRLAQLNADYDPTVEGFGVGNVDLAAYRASLHATLDEILGPASLNTSVTRFDGFDDAAGPLPPEDAALRAALDCHLSLSCAPQSAPLPASLYATARTVSPVPAALESWLETDPSLVLRLLDDAGVSAFVRARFPRVADTFDALPLKILKFDLFRLLVLLAHGGTYTDADTRLVRPLAAWGERAEDRTDAVLAATGVGAGAPQLVVGFEWARRTEMNALNALYTRQAGLVQWTFSAQAGHPILIDAVRRVLRHTARAAGGEPALDSEGPLHFDPTADRMVLEWSGPAVLTDSVSRYLRTRYGQPLSALASTPHPVRVGDALVLPLQALNARTGTAARLVDWALGRGWAPWSEAWARGCVVHEHAASWWGQKLGKGKRGL
ncbi:hypothetical protein JCM3770_003577 [Rhodotorula araucariae]